MVNVLTELKYLFKRFVLIANVLPGLLGFIMAARYYNRSFEDIWVDFILFLVGSAVLVAGALTLNNWLEADVDKLMERTKQRPSVTGSISLRAILILGISLSLVGQLLLLLINMEVAIFGFIGWYTYVVVYTVWTKRRVTWNTHVGSLSGAVTPMMGWAVIGSVFHPIPLTLFAIMFLWQMPHTYAIAIRKYEDYARSGLKMLPVVRGYQVTIRRTVVYMALLLIIPLFLTGFSNLFYILISLLNLGWLAIGIAGFKAHSIKKWANHLFASSLIYLLVVYLLYIVFLP
ncbi:protoheme IX farnesyltransferase [Gracilibacillus orientalis]|uniref:Protoheme IX farnesyltransferase n=1 Tax=Gracilibacillus orientalis TaxID=334253 RepID=A0A1I4HMT9_9BACI|nr:heme o synthase [Gracilibacillus orientalis]SFL43053.1 protoheme IX farnesyltransferase [Gracilibacillus orientalis]